MRRFVVTATATLGLLAGIAVPAFAHHTHVRQLGSGACVILAAEGGEKYVELPHADEYALNRRHPLHVNVHLGQAGTRQGEAVVWVLGTEPAGACTSYVNP